MKYRVIKKFRHPDNWDHIVQPGDKLPDNISDSFIDDMINRGRIEITGKKETAETEEPEVIKKNTGRGRKVK